MDLDYFKSFFSVGYLVKLKIEKLPGTGSYKVSYPREQNSLTL